MKVPVTDILGRGPLERKSRRKGQVTAPLTQDLGSAPPGPEVGSVGAQEAGLDDAHFFPGGGSLREERIPEHKSNGV